MAVPYDTSLLINLLRENCVSINVNSNSSRGNTTAPGTGINTGSNNYTALNEIHSRILGIYETRSDNTHADPIFYQKNFPKLFNASKNSPPLEITSILDNDRFGDKANTNDNDNDNNATNNNDDSTAGYTNVDLTPQLRDSQKFTTANGEDTTDNDENKQQNTSENKANGDETLIAKGTSVDPIQEVSESIPLPKRSDSLMKRSDSRRKSSIISLTETIDSTSSSISTKSGSTTTQSANPKQKQQGLFNLTRLIRPVRHSSTSSHNANSNRGQRTQTIQEESEEDVANSGSNIPFINNKSKSKKLFGRGKSSSDSSEDDDDDDDSDLISSNSSKVMSRNTTFNSNLDTTNDPDSTTNNETYSNNEDDDQLSGSFEAATSDEEFITSDNDFNDIDSDDLLDGLNDSSLANNSTNNPSDQSSDFNFNDELDSDSFSQDSDYIPEADESLDASSTPLLYRRGLRLPDIPSVSKISFRSRANTTSSQMNKYLKHSNLVTSAYQNTPPQSALISKRKPPPMSSTINANVKPSTLTTRNSKSTSNMLSLANTIIPNAGNDIQQQIESKLFEQSIVKRDLSNMATRNPQKSSLSALIDNVNNPLTFFEHIGTHIKPERKSRRRDVGKRNTEIDDNTFQISVSIENVIPAPMFFKVLKSAKVVDLIGLTLFTIQKEIHEFNIDISKISMNPNHWSLYVSDDGELLDDFGVLDRKRQMLSYGTDEFAMVPCSDEEAGRNEKLTPMITDFNDQLLQQQLNQDQGSPSTQLRSAKKSSVVTQMGTLGTMGTLRVGGELKNTLLATDVTPVSSMNKQNDITPYFGVVGHADNNDKDEKHRGYAFDSDDSDDEVRVTTKSNTNKAVTTTTKSRSGKVKPPRKNDTARSDGNGGTSGGLTSTHQDQGDLADTDIRRQPSRRQSFSQMARPNIDNASSKLNKLMNNKTLSSIWHNTLNDLDISNRSSGISDINYDKSMVDASLPTSYHRWTVWRRQQVSFKNRVERSLAVDGFEIYILPFSENRGSWNNNAKTSSFHVTQITKCKQSSKVPYQFKIYVNKSGTLKRYYLEAVNTNQCKEIVMTIQSLVNTYKAEG